ncbi:hypothetical protein NXW37_29645 [Bacteroides thetaiotaomicron]|nr:hypothetical protein [Bacteroides thetaiotaomicron]
MIRYGGYPAPVHTITFQQREGVTECDSLHLVGYLNEDGNNIDNYEVTTV